VLRTVLAAALATALVGLAIPVVDDARVGRSDRAVRAEIAALDRAADSLVAADEVTPGPGARRTVGLSLPESSWSAAGVEFLTIRDGTEPDSHGRSTVVYRLDGGRERRVRLDAPLSPPGDELRIDGGGRHRIVLSLVRVDGTRAIRVHRERADRRVSASSPRGMPV
jgi:hypothetical protein